MANDSIDDRIENLELPKSAFYMDLPSQLRNEIREWYDHGSIPGAWSAEIAEALKDNPTPETLRDWIVESEKKPGGVLNFD